MKIKENFSMNTVKVRNLELGNGIPAICIPNVGKAKEDILSLTRTYLDMHMDLMEWRMDWYEDVEDIAKVTELVKELRDVMGDTPLLCTFRTDKEGGVHPMSTEKYAELNKAVAATGNADIIDVEIFTGDDTVREMIDAIHASGAKVIASNHDFDKTPEKDEIVRRLCKMQELGADIPKIAVMPTCRRDVLTLLCATEEMYTEHADRPIITMSMAGTGLISRLCGEVFGSALTFGAAKKASAPGQAAVNDLNNMLQFLHENQGL
jgi:3-dehydroquinate dehydratase-1